MVHVEPLGILLGTIFVVSVASLLIWLVCALVLCIPSFMALAELFAEP